MISASEPRTAVSVPPPPGHGAAAGGPAILEVRNLSVTFRTENGPIHAVQDVSFALRPQETLALVGESGSGKSVTSLAIMRLTPPAPRVRLGGSVLLSGGAAPRDLATLDDRAMRLVRGNEISMIFQEPMTSLNPVHHIGDQIAEAVMFHRGVSRRAALARAVELLDRVGIPEARRRLSSYPHHLSGGMRQRVMIAIALACDPRILIADEPTTALDVTVQAQILALLRELQTATGMAIIFITHNLGVVAEIADQVMVMYAGRIVEQGGVVPVMKQPRMPYTQGLLRSVPRMDLAGQGGGRLEAIPGSVPDPLNLPPGCAFAPRCGHAEQGICDAAIPPLEPTAPGHSVRCARWRELAMRGA
ncbi:ABC transporter ATP-binding protein [Labrys monachus]|uniref:Oligopeptide transport system ATP-binding protein n=1 Tax=Labrys monachus TaxID=217067 RepID=A0ABU0F9Q9_9HYPH|nr:ABC transporter ATP-binding protein [Labrys monachus]MDQ0391325.1 oligopeptide transport system ATP-binding protein [Labrys monachus]